jgi:hypothetical protein
MAMAYDANGVPVRRGRNKQLTLDLDAIQALEELAPGPGAQGRVVSELLRAELVRREERQRLRHERQQAALEGVGADGD